MKFKTSISRQSLKAVGWDLSKTAVSAFIGFGLAYITFSKQFDANEKARLNDNLNKLLDINMQYPYVEDSSYIDWWNRHERSTGDSSLRYQTYGEYVFNFLQNVSEYFNYDKKKIMAFVDMRDLVEQHRVWLFLPENSGSFPKRFLDFVNREFK